MVNYLNYSKDELKSLMEYAKRECIFLPLFKCPTKECRSKLEYREKRGRKGKAYKVYWECNTCGYSLRAEPKEYVKKYVKPAIEKMELALSKNEND